MKRIELKYGDRFGDLTYQMETYKKVIPSGQKIRVVTCLCDCGKLTNVILSHLVRGRIRSCGKCNDVSLEEKSTRLFNSWRGMKYRVKEIYFQKHLYFDKKISIVDEWKYYKNFKKWSLKNGYNENLYIDRIDNSKGYSPNNCRWVTSQENCNNRYNTQMLIIDGKKIPITKACKDYNLPTYLVRARVNRGWDHKKALTTPARKLRKME